MKYFILSLLFSFSVFSQVHDRPYTSPFDQAVFDDVEGMTCSFFAFPVNGNLFEFRTVIPTGKLTKNYDCQSGAYKNCNGKLVATAQCFDYEGACKYRDNDIFMLYDKSLSNFKIFRYEDGARVDFYNYKMTQPNNVGFCLNNKLQTFSTQR